MRRIALALASAAALAPGPAAWGQQVQPPFITYRGDWLETPSLAELDKVRPTGVKTRIYVSLACQLSKEGRLTDCTVVSEDPKGSGAGAAALTLTRRFRAPPPDPYRDIIGLRIMLAWPGEGGSCLPPYCTAIPAPPPPPPPR